MARVILNSAIDLARGRIGDVVFRQHKGGMVAQARQVRHQPWSRPQLRHRDHFKIHTRYAASVRADPALRMAYAAAGAKRKKPLNYWQTAIRDHARPPEISRVSALDFRPISGGDIAIWAHDDFKVARVHVTVRDATGAVTGTGEAQQIAEKWHYRIPAPAPRESPATTVVVTVFDRPGNFAIGTFGLG